ncbi:MAG: isoprenylcysteine carboxylmethyltransferase family protein [Pseudomonadota bacterium]
MVGSLRRTLVALLYGAICHSVFGLAALIMAISLATGLSWSFGTVSWPWAIFANLILIAQFPLLHSWLLTQRGRRILGYFAPFGYGATLTTTTYAIIASLQLLVLFVLWTPSDILIWQPKGIALIIHSCLFALSWMMLGKAVFDMSFQLQSGALGWIALVRNKQPEYPDMPETGLFKYIRQPIYLAFALILWTGPIWTLDKLILASLWGGYCFVAPIFKERRQRQYYGERFDAYVTKTGYWLPRTRFSEEKNTRAPNDHVESV